MEKISRGPRKIAPEMSGASEGGHIVVGLILMRIAVLNVFFCVPTNGFLSENVRNVPAVGGFGPWFWVSWGPTGRWSRGQSRSVGGREGRDRPTGRSQGPDRPVVGRSGGPDRSVITSLICIKLLSLAFRRCKNAIFGSCFVIDTLDLFPYSCSTIVLSANTLFLFSNAASVVKMSFEPCNSYSDPLVDAHIPKID